MNMVDSSARLRLNFIFLHSPFLFRNTDKATIRVVIALAGDCLTMIGWKGKKLWKI